MTHTVTKHFRINYTYHSIILTKIFLDKKYDYTDAVLSLLGKNVSKDEKASSGSVSSGTLNRKEQNSKTSAKGKINSTQRKSLGDSAEMK